MKSKIAILCLSIMTLCAGVTFATDTGVKEVPKMELSIEKATTFEVSDVAHFQTAIVSIPAVGAIMVSVSEKYGSVAFVEAYQLRFPDPQWTWCDHNYVSPPATAPPKGFRSELNKPGSDK